MTKDGKGAASADLHSRPRSIGELARDFNISRRMVFLALELRRSGRDDLVALAEAGQITVREALRQAKPEKHTKPGPQLAALRRAWLRASDAEKVEFLKWIES